MLHRKNTFWANNCAVEFVVKVILVETQRNRPFLDSCIMFFAPVRMMRSISSRKMRLKVEVEEVGLSDVNNTTGKYS